MAHEDKRLHGPRDSAENAIGRKGGRKSQSNEDGSGKNTKDVGKAAKRKEQNRAAQKAFRERRENKVKDVST